MYQIVVPGIGNLVFEHLLLDMNGTVSTDGLLIPGVKWRIIKLREKLNIYLVTADTFGSASSAASQMGVNLKVVSPLNGLQDKEELVAVLGSSRTIAIGNGFNDVSMLKTAGLSIVVIGQEGCSVDALKNAMIAVRDIRDALDLILEPRRLIATLRT